MFIDYKKHIFFILAFHISFLPSSTILASFAKKTKLSESVDDSDRSNITTVEHEPIVCKPTTPECPTNATENKEDLIEINFENIDLTNLLSWVSETFGVSFLREDLLNPLPQGAKALEGNKITFQTNEPLTKKRAWELFIKFLDLFGFSLYKTDIPNVYKIVPTAPNSPQSISRSPLNSYINVDWRELPDSDQFVRYIYFVRNSSLSSIQSIVDAFRSTTATLKPLQDQNAFILTDRSSNIRSIMHIIQEIDQNISPEGMSVLELKNADAEDVVKLYNNLTKTEDPRGLSTRFLGSKKQPTNVYFPENLRLIAERRNNLLIILGDIKGIKRVEEFILNHIDTELKIPYSPLHVYELQYTNAEDIANILNTVTKFAQQSPAAQSGGVREGDKYLQPMSIVAEPAGNRLLVKAEKEDYLKIRDIIRQLDIKQPQIAIEVLIVNVISQDNRELGVQIRNQNSSTLNKNVNFQTSGFFRAGRAESPPVVNQENGSLIANLISLAESQSPGATLLSIANSATGVWGIFKILQTYVNTNLISNPFLITTNKYTAEVSIGETRRVLTGEVKGTRDAPVLGDVTANLTLAITPQINKIGIINLDININIDTFSDVIDPENANRETKTIKTNANIGNKQVLALGGLLKDNYDEITSKVPILGDIPFVGWIFKNKAKIKRKDNLLLFISPRIVEPQLAGGIDNFTKDKAELGKKTLCQVRKAPEIRDPIHRWFFKDRVCENTEYIDNFLAQKHEDVCVQVPPSLYCDERCSDPSILAQVDKKNNVMIKQEPIASLEKTAIKSFNDSKKRQSSVIAMVDEKAKDKKETL